MTKSEKIEFALVPLSGIAAAGVASSLPLELEIGQLFLLVSILVLAQGLSRDLWLLVRARRSPSTGELRAAQCMCIESTVGVLGIVVGFALIGTGFGRPIALSATGWGVLVAASLTFGFLIKDFVIEWNPWRIRREKDHLNLLVKWRP